MDTSADKPPRLEGAFRRTGDAVLGLLQARVRLFALELQCEKLRAIDLLTSLGIVLAFGTLGLAVATAALALYLWEVARYTGLGALSVLLLATAYLLLRRLRLKLAQSETPLADSIEQFEKDRACLRTPD